MCPGGRVFCLKITNSNEFNNSVNKTLNTLEKYKESLIYVVSQMTDSKCTYAELS